MAIDNESINREPREEYSYYGSLPGPGAPNPHPVGFPERSLPTEEKSNNPDEASTSPNESSGPEPEWIDPVTGKPGNGPRPQPLRSSLESGIFDQDDLEFSHNPAESTAGPNEEPNSEREEKTGTLSHLSTEEESDFPEQRPAVPAETNEEGKPDQAEEEKKEPYTTPEFLSGVVFEKRRNPRTGEEEYTSANPAYKRVILDPNFPYKPEPGVAYEVAVIHDSQPNEPNKGFYAVRLIEEQEVNLPLVMRTIERKGNVPPIEFDYERNKVYLLDVELDYNPEGGPLVPSPERFRSFTLDQNTLETLRFIARAVSLRQPCFLEGDTATSKTSAIEYLAMLTNNEIERFNFDGQTDTSEMIGKFVPNDGQLQIKFETLLRDQEKLTAESRAIIANAQREKRALDEFESQKIATLEGLTISEWRWQDGAVPRAMKRGAWLIYDEYGLGDPSIRERTNSVLERTPVLVLSENGGTKIGAEGEPIGRNFRIFGTNNPDYAGRIPLTPADRDRWTMSKYVKSPSEEDYKAMATLMVYGEQPKVTVHGKEYQSEKVEPTAPRLSRIGGMREFIAAFAKFHREIFDLASTPGKLRRGSKESYTFTRRGFGTLLQALQDYEIVDRHAGKRITIESDPKTIILRALEDLYLSKIGEEDKKKITDKMEAIGISENNWQIKLTGPEAMPRFRTTPV